MDAEQISALLGRPLTSTEVANFDKYIEIARESLDYILCTRLCDDSNPRIYDAREGYSSLFVDIFTDIDEVKIGGKVVNNYSVRQWDRRDGDWFNSIVFDSRFTSDKEVEVSANWGFNGTPADLESVLAGLFDLVTKKAKHNPAISQKRVEDFSVSLKDVNLDSEFMKQYSQTIRKYSLCGIPNVKHGGC